MIITEEVVASNGSTFNTAFGFGGGQARLIASHFGSLLCFNFTWSNKTRKKNKKNHKNK